ncbi:hypothetical protein BpHYR1_035124 [Brachionus plicatilis]|uniref:Uncharacterized protein n=1 Tax=Brachionus plicatilis TaxID=10195 RepID=A0A3M7RJK5_BRAPC|nr:hypothetical protein BpHYR1_035124 [Brachionus plicatilis]
MSSTELAIPNFNEKDTMLDIDQEDWNSLTKNAINAKTINSFKAIIDKEVFGLVRSKDCQSLTLDKAKRLSALFILSKKQKKYHKLVLTTLEKTKSNLLFFWIANKYYLRAII